MTLLWADGFDHYGLDLNNMLDGVYATAENIELSTAHPGTGTHGIFVNDESDNSSGGGLRKVLTSSTTKMGAIGRFYFPSLPVGNTSAAIFDFVSSTSTRSHVTCFVDSNGCLRFHKEGDYSLNGGTGTLIALSDPLITSNAQHHIEVQVYIHATAGWVRAAVNGVHRYQATGLDTLYDSSGIVSVRQTQPYYGTSAGVYPGHFYMDDYQLYDFTGSSAIDTDWCPTVDGAGIATGYIGELGGYILPPNADTAEADWGKSTGSSGYALIDEATPNDNDYIYSSSSGDLSEFAVTDLPEEITYIRGLQIIGRLSKADAGAAMTKFGMKSVAAVTDAAERPITTEPTYWWDFINVDPNSSTRWTRSSLNAAWVRLTRSA